MSDKNSKPFHESLPGVWCVDVNHPSEGRTCCYLLVGDGDDAALIDCGAQQGIDNIVAATEAAGLAREQLKWVIATHAHLDHCGAAGNLLQIFPKAKLAAHSSALYHLINPHEKLISAVRDLYGGQYYDAQYEGLVAADSSRTRDINEGDTIVAGGHELRVLYTPGHAWHHVSLHDPANDVIYTGDAYGVSYMPPSAEGDLLVAPVMPPTHFSPADAIKSLRRLRDVNAGHVALTHYDIIANRPDYADKQIATLEEWTEKANSLAHNDAALVDKFLNFLEEWYRQQAVSLGYDGDAVMEMHRGDSMLSAKGFAHWRKRAAN